MSWLTSHWDLHSMSSVLFSRSSASAQAVSLCLASAIPYVHICSPLVSCWLVSGLASSLSLASLDPLDTYWTGLIIFFCLGLPTKQLLSTSWCAQIHGSCSKPLLWSSAAPSSSSPVQQPCSCCSLTQETFVFLFAEILSRSLGIILHMARSEVPFNQYLD